MHWAPGGVAPAPASRKAHRWLTPFLVVVGLLVVAGILGDAKPSQLKEINLQEIGRAHV